VRHPPSYGLAGMAADLPCGAFEIRSRRVAAVKVLAGEGQPLPSAGASSAVNCSNASRAASSQPRSA